MTDRDESLLRQLYLVPECPTTNDVWQQWRDQGHSASIQEVRAVLWGLDPALYDFRAGTDNATERLVYLMTIESALVLAWQASTRGKVLLLVDKIERALIEAQRLIRETVMQGVPV